jgi:hypothetical protein
VCCETARFFGEKRHHAYFLLPVVLPAKLHKVETDFANNHGIVPRRLGVTVHLKKCF